MTTTDTLAAGLPSLLATPGLSDWRAEWHHTDVASLLDRAANVHAARPALVVAGQSLTYGDLFDSARRVATALVTARPASGARSADVRTSAIMASRTTKCFTALLGTVLSGAAYVPLNPRFPINRSEYMLRASGAETLAIEAHDLESMAPLLARWSYPLGIVVLDVEDVSEWAQRLPMHRVLGATDIAQSKPAPLTRCDGDAPLYILFTSGSTGTPKGVVVTHRNVLTCLASLGARYGITSTDRFSQNFELTFDLSVFDMFLCWLHGASLHVAPRAQQAAPARFVQSAGITIWFAVPSMAIFMERFKMLQPGTFPSLRWSLFCGERLPLKVAQAWADAAPASQVENLYGPTEVTIACTLHRLSAGSTALAEQGSVPIGVPFPSMRAAVVDEAGHLVAAGVAGELVMSGPQVALGYWREPAKTVERFVAMSWDDTSATWYKTGDLAKLVAGTDLVHLGRTDDQVKIRGYRIELGEIESVLRAVLRTEAVSVIAVPGESAQPPRLVAFVAGTAPFDADEVIGQLGNALPDYMHPSEFRAIDLLPLNSNGKTDKKALLSLCGG